MKYDTVVKYKQKNGGWLFYNIISQILINSEYNLDSIKNHIPKEEEDDLFFALEKNELVSFNKKLSDKILSELSKPSDLLEPFKGHEIIYLTLWYDCNFRCPYCYQQHEYFQKTGNEGDILNIEKSLRIIDKKSNNGKTPPRQIHLFGGEPLLDHTTNVEIIEKVLNHIHNLMPDIELMVTTNGYNLNVFLPLLAKYQSFNWRFSVTIGTSEKQHNNTRILRVEPKKSTLKTIIDNIALTNNTLENVKFKIRFNCNEDEERFEFLIDQIQFLELKKVNIDLIEIRTIIKKERKPILFSKNLLINMSKLTKQYNFSSAVKFTVPPHMRPIFSSLLNEKSIVMELPFLCDAIVKKNVLEFDPPFNIQMCELVPELFTLNSHNEINVNQVLFQDIKHKRDTQCLTCPFLMYCFGEICKVIQFIDNATCSDILYEELLNGLSLIGDLSPFS